MTLEQYLAWLEAAIVKMELGAPAMANAMAEYLAWRTANDTLRRTVHSPGMYHKARPGAPPASASGNLARSMFTRPASAGMRSTAWFGNDAKYAKLLEHGGCVLKSPSGKVMHWTDSEGSWFHDRLPASEEFPAHPFISTTLEEAIADGSLHRVAIAAFMPYDP